ncbi:hypothetical protein [Streptomyces sp. NBC_01340]|uniref:hypothetical protein n=1 Tax=Streptomyces sp. NBC_01340 TaxID=2903830 RepID=UPI003DA4B57B
MEQDAVARVLALRADRQVGLRSVRPYPVRSVSETAEPSWSPVSVEPGTPEEG